MTDSAWELAHEYGEGCKVYVDRQSLSINGDFVRASVRHYLVPPGVDKRNQKAVREIVFDKEFDLEKLQARYHSIVFTYMDGSIADPLRAEPQWVPAEKGSLVELNYVRALATPSKKRWWLF